MGQKEWCYILECTFQAALITEIKKRFAGAFVLKNDSSYVQGIPDITILYNDKWAMLEVKKSKTAMAQPNQDYYINKLNEMSYAAFIFPENKEEILHELEHILRA